jgi:hypothetical protein
MLGVLPVIFPDGSVQLEFSVDDGATWKIDPARAPLFNRQPPYTPYEVPIPPTFTGNGVIAVVLGTDLRLRTGGAWTLAKPSGLASVYQIEFINPRAGWAVGSHIGCGGPGSAPRCTSRQDLLRSVDAGHSWTVVPVRFSG